MAKGTHTHQKLYSLHTVRERERGTDKRDRQKQRERIYIDVFVLYIFLKANFLRFRPTLCVLSKTANLLRATQTADKPDDLFPSGAEDKKKIVFKFSLDGSGI